MDKIEVTVIGAGVVGLAVSLELSKSYKDIFIIEKNFSFGQETSSRNSEVIHAGIYYPKGSLKAKTCIEGRQMLYEYCLKHNIPCKKTGKLIVAIDNNELADLKALFDHGVGNGLNNLKLLSKTEFKKLEPNAEAQSAIYSPETGIIDSHELMKNFLRRFEAQGGEIAYNTEVIAIEKVRDGFEVTVRDQQGGDFSFFTRILINSAGLNSDKVSALAGLSKEEYKLKYNKGTYFRVNQNKAGLISRLIYPVPKNNRAGLGIHATLDLGGSLRLGPDDEYIDKIDYNVDMSKQKAFYESVCTFLPFIGLGDLSADTVGIRPKLQGPEDNFRDFIVKDETENSLPGFINLIGIESPGLTASLSIAKFVKGVAAKFMPRRLSIAKR